jgi:hypothetical protein
VTVGVTVVWARQSLGKWMGWVEEKEGKKEGGRTRE